MNRIPDRYIAVHCVEQEIRNAYAGPPARRLLAPEMLARPARVLRTIALACIALLARPAFGQDAPPFDHPLFLSPVRENDAAQIDVGHVRLTFRIDPAGHTIQAHMFAEVAILDSEAVRLAIPIAGVDVERVSLVASDSSAIRDTAWTVLGDTLSIPVTSLSAGVAGLEMSYTLSGGPQTMPLGDDAGPWTQVWTPFELGVPDWFPLPVHLDDRFSAVMRVSVPEAWTVFSSGRERFNLELDGVRILEATFPETATVSNIGFVAMASVSALSENGIYMIDDGSQDPQSVEEAVISMGRMGRFFDEMTGHGSGDSTRTVIFSGPGRPMSSGAGLAFIPAFLLPDGLHPAEDDLSLAAAVAGSWVVEMVPLAGWTDVWIREALSVFMAARYVRDRYGETEYANALWQCRDRYLGESRSYIRPLVWDRWNDPTDLLDEHAACKGAWILHMLSARYGDDLVWFAIQYLSELGGESAISSEEVREALERAAGQNLSEFFDQWVYAAGHPVMRFDYSVAADQESIQLTTEQTQDGFLVPDAFSLDLDVESASLSGIDRSTVHVATRTSTASIPVQLRPQYVRFDPEGTVLFEYAIPQEPATLVSSLRRQETDRSRYVTARALLTTAVDPSLLIGIRPALSSQNSPLVDRILLRVIARMAPSVTALRDILAVAADTTSRAQATAIAALGAFKGEAEARRMALSAANTSSDPLILAAAVESLVRLDSTLAWRVLQSAMVTESTGNIVRRTAIRLVPGAPVEEQVKLNTLLGFLSDHNDARLRWAAVRALKNFAGVQRVRTAVLALWETAGVQMRAAVLDVLESSPVGNREREALTRWLHSEPEGRLRRRLETMLGIGAP